VSPGLHPIHGTPSGLDPNEVVPQIVQLLLDAGLPSLADSHNTDDRCDPYGYPQNRKDASHLVSEQRYQCGSKQGCVIHDSSSDQYTVYG
jgi:hypothetical protein